MELSIAKDLDKILNFLDRNKSTESWFEILDELKIDKKNKELLFRELDSTNFIQANLVQGGNHYIRITSDGKAFLQSSSFLRLRKELITDKTRTATQHSVLIITQIITIIGIIFSGVLGYFSYRQNESIKELNIEIKTLKQETKDLQDNLSSKTTFKTNDNKR